ncbi:hypothetical protein BLA18112_03325 [Burkholderia lata]|uniref:Lipoprotein n=1 Tax=Burkholderia lata (strain ATCC 17760 / DSM 23089 / LMG 22485 / NCIMB 9086 / R18194 / 383) TaxID=482957 RepID=A0A6P2VJR2_BURL3|nr:hypothetical protein [Burkholderia lata]VWC91084.1 hypothetical protein BLA18112_03325 [Burkholderia lata]
MNKYAIAGAIISGAMLVACGNGKDNAGDGGSAPIGIAEPCGSSSVKSGKSFSITGQGIPILMAPNAEAEKLVNEKASQIMHSTEYMTVDNSTTVTEECTKGDWSRIYVTSPEWLRETHIGWIPTSSLRKPQADAAGRRIFTEADFIFDDVTRPYKTTIIEGVNRIYRENDRCHDIRPDSAYISGSKGTKEEPVFYVTCGAGAAAFNVFFSRTDISGDKKLVAPSNIGHTEAVSQCQEYVRSHATHASTVNFSHVADLRVTDHPNGNTRVTSTFTAKNGYNLELKYNISCLLNSSGLIEANISEAQ